MQMRDNEKANFGIKILREESSFLAIWKSSNVAISKFDRVFRPAAPPIKIWLKEARKNKVPVDDGTHCLLTANTSGILVYPTRYHRIARSRLRFVAVATSNREMDIELNQELKVLQKSRSCKYGNISLVSVNVTNPNSSISSISKFLKDVGFQILDESFLALIEVRFFIDDGTEEIAVSVDMPSKFYKFMRREDLHYSRQERHLAEERIALGPSSYSRALFKGREFLYPSVDSLCPRKSSECIVDAAVRLLTVNRVSLPSKTMSILDLGTASGALLLSVLVELSDRTNERVIGLGIDLNVNALTLATRNAKEFFDNTDSDDCYKFLHHDFNKLKELNSLLENAGKYEGFDIVLCNPPYISARSMSSRLTHESSSALVGGYSGYEVYDSICRSLRSAPQILKRGGYVVFQLSAAENAYRSVSEIIKSHKFVLKDSIVEVDRGVQRGIVFSVENT